MIWDAALGKGRGHVGDTAAALRMLDAFTSVGARSFVVTKTDIHQKLTWGKTYVAQDLRQRMPAMVRTAAIRKPFPIPDGETIQAGENLIIRPTGPGVAFVQLDDLNSEQLDRVRPAVFLLHATSPGNHQAWIAVSGVPEGKEAFKEFTRRVRRAVGGNDKSASHATRVAGTENFKLKYAPNFPTVTILETHPGRIMTPEQLEALGLLAKSEPVKARALEFTSRGENRSGKPKQWPSYEKALAGAPQGQDGPDRSRADFWFSYLALQRGWSAEETEAKLLEVSEKARERVRGGDEGYVHVTVANAGAWLERSRQRSRA
jgi:hypothetical protein